MMRKTNLLALVVHLDLIFGMGKKAIRKVIFDTLECDSRILGKCCPWQRHILVLVGGYSRVVRSFFFQLFVIHCCWAAHLDQEGSQRPGRLQQIPVIVSVLCGS